MALRRTALLWGALPLLAQSGPTSTWGIHGQFIQPTGQFKEFLFDSGGFGVGLHQTVDWGDGNRLRGRLEWNKFEAGEAVGTFKWPSGATSVSPGLLHNEAENEMLAFDYERMFTNPARGFYSIVGLSAVRWRINMGSPAGDHSFSTTKLGWTAGLGYQVNAHLGTELRANGGKIGEGISGNTLCASLTWRF